MSNAFQLQRYYVILIIIWIGIWIALRYYCPLELRIRHTYQLPSTACTGTLVSDFDSWNSVREGLMELYILAPFAAVFMLWTRERIGFGLNLAAVFIGLVWGTVNFGYDINDIVYGQVAPTNPYFDPTNLARDNRWCLYYAGQPNTQLICSNTGPCGVVDVNTLQTNGPFVWRFVFNLLMVGWIALSLWISILWYRYVVNPQSIPTAPVQSRYQIPGWKK